MKRLRLVLACLGVVLVGCCGVRASASDCTPVTTSSSIAIENLNGQIAQLHDEAGVEDLLLLRARFLADYEALDRASRMTEGRGRTASELLKRARARSAVHRFAEALDDIARAERYGASQDEVVGLRASILIAIGRAVEVVPQLEAAASNNPGYSTHSALAIAYAAVGRFADADRLYVAALSDLDTTSPFPYAWIYFARGLMWTEQAGDRARGESLYAQALCFLPEFATANIHSAEIEVARGDLVASIVRLERVVGSSNEPEALALLGALHVRTGDPIRGWHEISLARKRFESLLARHPLAFADHAAEFYLGPGADQERTWSLAQQNLANRETDRAYVLAIKAARATGRFEEACDLVSRAHAHLTYKSTTLFSQLEMVCGTFINTSAAGDCPCKQDR
jgi:tetratricopeptide (TPR) repeat protein